MSDKPSPTRRKRKILQRVLFGIACFFTLIALIYAFENWRGKRAWNAMLKELKAEGNLLLLADIIPAEIPDDQNFVATPFWTAVFELAEELNPTLPLWSNHFDTNKSHVDDLVALLEENRSAEGGPTPKQWAPIDLAAWAIILEDDARSFLANREDPAVFADRIGMPRDAAGRIVLEGLKDYEPFFQQMKARSQLPYSRYPIDYTVSNPVMILLPHLSHVRNICRVLNVRVAAKVALGETDAALEDLRLMHRLAESMKEEPVLISFLVRLACHRLWLSAAREGMAGKERWNDAQLTALQSLLARPDFVKDCRNTIRFERCFGNSIFQYIHEQSKSSEFINILDSGSPDESYLRSYFGLMPQGWLYFEQCNYNRLFGEYVDYDLGAPGVRIDPRLVTAKSQSLEDKTKGLGYSVIWRHQVLSSLLLPSLTGVFRRTAYTQAEVELFQLACALERYHLARKEYPESLSPLHPDYIDRIPNDVTSNQPYKYRRDGRRYLVYSPGWNGVDDNGEQGDRDEEGDWVYRCP